MARTHTTDLPDDLLGNPISEEEAGEQKAALDRVLHHLSAVGIHTELINRLTIEAGRRPNLAAESRRYPPQLIVYAGARKIATISIGPRSGSYLIELVCRDLGTLMRTDPIEVVPVSLPDRAAQLVTEHAGAPT